MDEGLDIGDMLYISCCLIDSIEISSFLYDKLVVFGLDVLISMINCFVVGEIIVEK